MIGRISIALFLIAAVNTSAQTNAPHGGDKLKNLIVYGKGFMFSVKEPAKWRADTEVANSYGVNVVFFLASQKAENVGHSIRVRVGNKVDENTAEDLKADIDGYRKQYPDVHFEDVTVGHQQYKTFSKLFFVPHKFYEYVAYLNPGPGTKLLFSVAMSKPKEPASRSELDAFREVVSSLTLLSK